MGLLLLPVPECLVSPEDLWTRCSNWPLNTLYSLRALKSLWAFWIILDPSLLVSLGFQLGLVAQSGLCHLADGFPVGLVLLFPLSLLGFLENLVGLEFLVGRLVYVALWALNPLRLTPVAPLLLEFLGVLNTLGIVGYISPCTPWIPCRLQTRHSGCSVSPVVPVTPVEPVAPVSPVTPVAPVAPVGQVVHQMDILLPPVTDGPVGPVDYADPQMGLLPC